MSAAKPKITPDLTPVEELSYEQAFAELESLVASLESEQRPLDEAVALFERGQALARRCADMLDKAELKIQQLTDGGLADFNEQP